MAEFWLGFALCWLLGTLLMWRMIAAHLTTDSAFLRLIFALFWPVMLWKEGR